MRPTIKNGVALFSPQGFLDGNNADSYFSLNDEEVLSNLKTDFILVSLKRVIFFNHNGLDSFVKLFSKIRKKNNISVGFCDYDDNKFRAIKGFYKNDISFSLFKTLEIAYLFASNFKSENKKILIYSSDHAQSSAMAIELHDNGHSPYIAKTLDEYSKKVKEGGYDYYIDTTSIGQLGQNIATRVAGNAIVYTISSFLDIETTNSFNMNYHNNSLNVGFRLFIFDAHKVVSMNALALNFFSKLANAAAEYNATICFAGMSFDKTNKQFKETLEDSGVQFFEKIDDILENKELLKELSASSAANIKHKRALNKQNVVELPRFINAAVVTMEMMTNAKAVKESAEIHNLTIDNQSDKIASSIGYYGDIDGMVVLVFPTSIAKKACELLVGEATDDLELILDTLAELVNIVGGHIKTFLSNDDINVNITLPRTYQNIDDLLEVIEDRKGVQVELSFDNSKFIFFLTR